MARKKPHASSLSATGTPVAHRPSVLTIPPEADFMASLAAGILRETAGEPMRLADYTVLVPDQTAATQLRQAFMQCLDGRTGVLPRIETPGDLDDDYISEKLTGQDLLLEALADIPPPITRLERQMALAEEVLKIPGMSSSVQKAIKLAGELGRFIDELQRYNIDIRAVGSFVPAAFSGKWQHTADFLRIITDTWPARLRDMGRVDPEEHKNILVQFQVAHWQQQPPAHPVIAAGFCHLNPAHTALLESVARMERGRVVLPGVDTTLDDKSWSLLTPVHPQYTFREMLDGMNVQRQEVTAWPAVEIRTTHSRANNPDGISLERAKLLREALRPAGTAEGWSRLHATRRRTKKTRANNPTPATPPAAVGIGVESLTGMDYLVCGTQQEEASVIALKMRETLETPGKTATLVTADRSLARRVTARLQYWNIGVPDGAGVALSDTGAGVFLLSSARLAAENWAPVRFLEALKHPLASLGEDRAVFREKLMQFEDLILHGPRPAGGAAGARDALAAAFNRIARRPKQTQTPEELAALQESMTGLVTRLETAGAAFFALMTSGQKEPFAKFIDSHLQFAEELAADHEHTGAQKIWRGTDGVRAAAFLTKIRAAAQFMPDMTGRDYVDVLYGLMRDVNVRPSATAHPYLKIMTPEQARLVKSDVMIVGGLNEGLWPVDPRQNPWLSAEMIRALGMPSPDVTTGAAALNFVQMTSHTDVLLTRALRSGSAPSIASPFLTRLLMVLRGAGLEDYLKGKSRLLDIHTAIHTPARVTPCDPPAPKPAVKHRPKELPVTGVEMLMRDPYSVYARYVLKLRRRDPLDASPNVAEKGNYTHAALERFVRRYPDKLPRNAEKELLKIGRETFKERMGNPSVQSFWWPRFERVAGWFVKFENERREMVRTLGTEVRGKLEIDLGDGHIFTLTCIADRIDRTEEDSLAIVDYKTGSVPLQKEVELGFAPQLTLEALIAYSGGFKGIEAQKVSALQYWKLSGGRPAADIVEVRGDVDFLVDEARAGVTELLRIFNDRNTPYLSNPRPDFAPRYQNYGHLSRREEWNKVKRVAADKRRRPPRDAQAPANDDKPAPPRKTAAPPRKKGNDKGNDHV